MEVGFRDNAILSYIGLPADYDPLPSKSPIDFLRKHLHHLPPHLITSFSSITTPKQRSAIPEIRNRRLVYIETKPKELQFAAAKSRWPLLWPVRERSGQEEAEEEREWAQKGFLDGKSQQVGKLATLLGDYEEEREAERVRSVRRKHVEAAEEEFVPEEDDSDSDMSDHDTPDMQESPEEQRLTFERRITERFIYGLLEVRVMAWT
ncbi:hypothetical protein HYDPIDRAFT_104785 [Hydnomerulius pinastri MD-312]|nr:hypothetical protein HYDPIDRAFT_104785 [Hydnomerulius pinastri MD-312]